MYGLDLLDFFRGKYSWRKLRVLITALPAASAFVEAQANDPDYAQWVASLPAPDKPSPPKLSEWTTQVGLLAAIADRIAELISLTSAVASGKKAGEAPTIPRPRTAVDRALRDARMHRHATLVAEVQEAQQRYAAQERG